MVTDLLHVDHAAVFEACLECLAEDWIEWLAPIMKWIQVSNRGQHDMLHTLYRVLSVRSSGQMEANGTWHEGNLLKNGPWRHAPNWETNGSQVEIAAHNGATHLSNDTLDGTSEIILCLHIIEREAAIFMSIWASVLVIYL
jgi:hypothetical protein